MNGFLRARSGLPMRKLVAFFVIALLASASSVSAAQQVTPLPTLPPAPVTTPIPLDSTSQGMPSASMDAAPLNGGPCLDSSRGVPQVLQPPAKSAMQIVRIDKVVAETTMIQGNVIGFLYTLHDGTTWLAQRHQDYMSAADARLSNLVLGVAHMPADTVTQFPPVRRFGVKTNYQEFFRVSIPAGALDPLRVKLVPCVVWPAGRDLPDPSGQ